MTRPVIIPPTDLTAAKLARRLLCPLNGRKAPPVVPMPKATGKRSATAPLGKPPRKDSRAKGAKQPADGNGGSA